MRYFNYFAIASSNLNRLEAIAFWTNMYLYNNANKITAPCLLLIFRYPAAFAPHEKGVQFARGILLHTRQDM